MLCCGVCYLQGVGREGQLLNDFLTQVLGVFRVGRGDDNILRNVFLHGGDVGEAASQHAGSVVCQLVTGGSPSVPPGRSSSCAVASSPYFIGPRTRRRFRPGAVRKLLPFWFRGPCSSGGQSERGARRCLGRQREGPGCQFRSLRRARRTAVVAHHTAPVWGEKNALHHLGCELVVGEAAGGNRFEHRLHSPAPVVCSAFPVRLGLHVPPRTATSPIRGALMSQVPDVCPDGALAGGAGSGAGTVTVTRAGAWSGPV